MSRSDVQDRDRIASIHPASQPTIIHPWMARSLFPPWLAWLAGWLLAPIATTPKAVHIQFEEPTSVQIIEQPRRRTPSRSLARSLKAKMGQGRTPSTDPAAACLPPSLGRSLANAARVKK